MQPEEVKRKLQAELADARIDVIDMTGTGDHFRVEVISPEFEGKSLVEQHQRINGILAAHLADGSIHALSIKTAASAPDGTS